MAELDSNYKLTAHSTIVDAKSCIRIEMLHAFMREAPKTHSALDSSLECACDARNYYYYSSIVSREAIIKRFREGIRMYTQSTNYYHDDIIQSTDAI